MISPEWLDAIATFAKESPLRACAVGITLLSAAHITRLVIAIVTFFVEMIGEDLAQCRVLLKRFGRAITPWRHRSLPRGNVEHTEQKDATSAGPAMLAGPAPESRLGHAKVATLRKLRARRFSPPPQLHARQPKRNAASEMMK